MSRSLRSDGQILLYTCNVLESLVLRVVVGKYEQQEIKVMINVKVYGQQWAQERRSNYGKNSTFLKKKSSLPSNDKKKIQILQTKAAV